MNDRSTTIVAPLARWSSRIAVFSASLLVVGVVLHRLTSFPTPVAINLFAVACGRSGPGDADRARRARADLAQRATAGPAGRAFGILLPLLMLAWPLAYVPAFLNLPPHQRCHHRCGRPAALRGARQAAHRRSQPGRLSGARFADEQQKAYPDLRTFVIDRAVEEAFELVEEAVRKLKWRVAAAEPADRQAGQGRRARGHRPDAWSSASPTTSSSAWRAMPTARASTCARPRATAMADLGQNADARAPLPRRAAGPHRRHVRRQHRRPARRCARRGPARWSRK